MHYEWRVKFLRLAQHIAQLSDDKSTKVGCIIVKDDIVVSTGYNGFPRKIISYPERHLRPAKYMWTEHAERNAIFNAARLGIALDGCSLFIASDPMWGPSCADCARAVIQSGIKAEYVDAKALISIDWRADCAESIMIAIKMFEEAGVGLYSCDA